MKINKEIKVIKHGMWSRYQQWLAHLKNPQEKKSRVLDAFKFKVINRIYEVLTHLSNNKQIYFTLI